METENKWVLKDSVSGYYFKCWTGIGPAGTESLDEAEIFDSKEDAMRSPAFTFSMTFYEPAPKEEGNKG